MVQLVMQAPTTLFLIPFVLGKEHFPRKECAQRGIHYGPADLPFQQPSISPLL